MTSRARLADVCELIMGLSPPGDTYNDESVGLPLLNGPTDFGPTHPTSSLFTTDPKRTCAPGALLFCVRGSTGRMNWADQKYAIGRGIAAITASTSEETRFVRYALEHELPVLLSRTSGSTMTMLKKGDLENFEIYWPQNLFSVSSILNNFDNLIENNRRRIELLEEAARLLYREWFVNFRYPGHEDVSLVDSGLGPIPQDWEIRSFNEVADFINGFAFKSSEHWLEEGLPIIKIKELKAGLGDDTPRYHGNDIDTKYFIDNGDVLFSWSAHLDAYVWAGGPGLLNQHLFVVKPYELSKLFVFHSLRGQMTEFRARAQGTTMKHIKRSALGEVFLRVPPPGIRQQFERTVSPMLDLQLELQSSNRLLTETRDLLLPRLVSGDLDISDLDLSLEAVS